MPTYMISVTCAAALSGIILSVIFYRLKVFNFRTAAAITMASLVTSLVMPGILSLIYLSGNNTQWTSMSAVLTVVSILVYIVLVFILSAAISLLLPKIKIRHRAAVLSETGIIDPVDTAAILPSDTGLAEVTEIIPCTGIETEALSNKTEFIEPEAFSLEAEGNEAETAAEAFPEPEEYMSENIMDGDDDMKVGDNYIEDIYLKFVGRNDENLETIANNEANEGFEENTDEKSVDSNENIDKMGIENNIHDSNILTIEECIDEAFRLRAAGDPEGSILYYMYALDKKPQKELTFWIILDICVMYKTLGQQDLALDILDSYYDIYGDEMDASVKEEIARNLTD